MTTKNILITGGQTNNNGAQAMIFITVDEIAKRFPDCTPIVLVNHMAAVPDSGQYRFRTVKTPPFKKRLPLMNRFLYRLFRRSFKDPALVSYTEMLENCEALIDISGYEFGANWGSSSGFGYLTRVMTAKTFGIPVYLFPQSFGPFPFTGIKGTAVNLLARHYLPYCKVIMAREEQGKTALEKQYRLKNVVLCDDMVLQNTVIDKASVFKEIPPSRQIQIAPASVAVIPNQKNTRYCPTDRMAAAYGNVVRMLLSRGRTVYLVYHSTEDAPICRRIKELFPEDMRVILIGEKWNCLDFEALVPRFDFVIASRFHSVVHAYRGAVPAVILGWADKYHALARRMGEEGWQIDIRDADWETALLGKTEEMDRSFARESRTISDHLQIVRKNNCFDYLGEK